MKVYEIRNSNGWSYIGCSKNIERRWNEHRKSLENNSHINPHLQNAWNKYGESEFEWNVLLELDSENTMFLEEAKMIESSDMLYNIAKGGTGGDTFTNNPNKEEYRKNLSEASKKRYQRVGEREKGNVFTNLTKEELKHRKKVWSDAKVGNKNSNFKHNTPVNQINPINGKIVKQWDYPSLVTEGGFNPKYVMKCCNKHKSYKSHKKFLWELIN